MPLNPKSSKQVVFLSAGLLVAFFLPWVQFFGLGASGYNLGQFGSYGNYVWIVPILSGGTIWVSIAGLNNRPFGLATGVVPLIGFLYVGSQLTSELGSGWGQALSIGAHLTILFSVAIIVAACVPLNDLLGAVAATRSEPAPTSAPAEKTMTCPKCGAKNPAERAVSGFCGHCGFGLSS